MGSSVKLNETNGIVRGTWRELKKYCKSKNIGNKYIKQDENGYYLKLKDRKKLHKRKRY